MIASRVGVKAPARFLCTAEEDSVSEIAEVTHPEADPYSFDAYNEAQNLTEMMSAIGLVQAGIQSVCWRTKSIETARISAIVRLITFACPARLWDVRERMNNGTKSVIIRIRPTVWRLNGNSAWLSGNVDWE